MKARIARTISRAQTGFKSVNSQSGKMGWILLWALGVPIPVLLVLFLLRGCT